jgi:hypothetical protein
VSETLKTRIAIAEAREAEEAERLEEAANAARLAAIAEAQNEEVPVHHDSDEDEEVEGESEEIRALKVMFS